MIKEIDLVPTIILSVFLLSFFVFFFFTLILFDFVRYERSTRSDECTSLLRSNPIPINDLVRNIG